MTRHRTSVTLAMILSATLFGIPPAQAQLTWKFTTIEANGFSEPPDYPSLNRGTVAFTRYFDVGAATLRPGIFMGNGGPLTTIVDWLTPVPNLPSGEFFGSLGNPSLDSGQVAFTGSTASGSGQGIYKSTGNALETVVDTSTQVPGAPAGTNFTFFDDPSLNNGQLVFSAIPSGVYKAGAGGGVAVVADTTTPIPISPILPPDFVVAARLSFFGRYPSLDKDEVAFWGSGEFSVLHAGSVPNPRPLRGVYLSTGGHLQVVADNFTPVPGHPQDTFNGFLSPSLHQGQVAFQASDTSGRAGIYAGTAGHLVPVAATDTLIPGQEPSTFSFAGEFPSINYGNVAFSNNAGIFLSTAGTDRALVKVFDESDLPNGQHLTDLDPPTLFHQALSGNSIAFSLGILDDNLGGTIKNNVMRADLVKVTFPDFSDNAQLKLNGSTQQAGNVLRLTPDSMSQAGSAFFPVPFTVGPDFSFHTHFAFQIGGVNEGGDQGSDGLAFVIHSDPRGAEALGNAGEGLGFGVNYTANLLTNQITPSVAIEFDTHQNFFDPNGNHVALILNGDVANHLAYTTPGFSLNGGTLNNGPARYVWIDYAGPVKRLDVFLSESDVKPASPAFTITRDLAPALGKEAFFGFTAATGAGFNAHDMLSWNLDVRSFPAQGDLNGDGCVDRRDLNLLLAAIHSPGTQDSVYDLNGDGKVDIVDARKLVTLFSNPLGAPCQ